MPSTSVLRGSLTQERYSLSVAGNSNVTLLPDQAKNAYLVFTGALTGSITVTIPVATDDAGKAWEIHNNTTGAFTLTIAGPTGAGFVVPQGRRVDVEFDGTNMIPADTTANRSDNVSIAVTTTAITLNEQQYGCSTITLTGTPSADRTVIFPAQGGGPWVVYNNTDNAQTLKVSGQTGISLASTKYCMVWVNGTDVKRLTADT